MSDGGGLIAPSPDNMGSCAIGNDFFDIFFDDNSYLYIYFSFLFLPRQKVGLKKIYRCSFEPGVIFENQKLREIFVSEATESCKGSKWGFFGVPSTTRLFPGG